MTAFEKVMETSFAEYLTSKTAYLQFLYPKMRMAGYLGKTPAFVQCAKAPYDVDGYYLDGIPITIACEIKENADHHSSMQVIMPNKRGSGLQYHQMEALVRVHEVGGLACVVWCNGGEIGFLDGTRLKAAKASVDTSLKAEKLGMPNQKGMRSILWGNFTPVKSNNRHVPLWLPPNPWAKTQESVAKAVAKAVLSQKVAYDDEAGACIPVTEDNEPINGEDDNGTDDDGL